MLHIKWRTKKPLLRFWVDARNYPKAAIATTADIVVAMNLIAESLNGTFAPWAAFIP
jgi:hypothetical protein